MFKMAKIKKYPPLNCRHNLKKSFTLLELIVAIVIILVIATISVPTYIQVRQRVLEQKATANLYNIYNAQKSFWLNLSMLPSSYTGSYANGGQITDLQGHVDFPTEDGDWNYSVTASSANTFQAQAQQINRGGATTGFYMYINETGSVWHN